MNSHSSIAGVSSTAYPAAINMYFSQQLASLMVLACEDSVLVLQKVRFVSTTMNSSPCDANFSDESKVNHKVVTVMENIVTVMICGH